VHVDHRHRHGIARDAAGPGEAWDPIDQGDVGRGAAHVEGEEPILAGETPD
jgi:hypothetical protein